MKEIPLSCGKVALVDDKDYDDVSQHSWTATQSSRRNRTWYAVRNGRSGEPCRVYLHRYIMGVLDQGRTIEVDHIDNDGLNNQRGNLRLCTHQQQACNKAPINDGRYKGVHQRRDTGRWVAQIMTHGRHISESQYPTAQQAALAHDHLARKHHGRYAWLNADHFPELRPEAT